MARGLIVLDGGLGGLGAEPRPGDRSPEWGWLVERGELVRVAVRPERTREAAWLGMEPGEGQMAAGPLFVAAGRVDPPERSVHFRLTVGSVNGDGVLGEPGRGPDAGEAAAVLEALRRLETPAVTVVAGAGREHGLVWERGSLEMGTVDWPEARGKGWLSVRPEGDGETFWRRFIDDSVNLLNELELNHVRTEEGLDPLNVAWPWGQGVRERVPMMPLRRGAVTRVWSDALSVRGLAYLGGDAVEAGPLPLRGLHPDWAAVRRWMEGQTNVLVTTAALAEMRRRDRTEELAYGVDGLMRDLVEPLVRAGGWTIGVVLLGAEEGLMAAFAERGMSGMRLPFDERTLEERRVETVMMNEAADRILRADLQAEMR